MEQAGTAGDRKGSRPAPPPPMSKETSRKKTKGPVVWRLEESGEGLQWLSEASQPAQASRGQDTSHEGSRSSRSLHPGGMNWMEGWREERGRIHINTGNGLLRVD